MGAYSSKAVGPPRQQSGGMKDMIRRALAAVFDALANLIRPAPMAEPGERVSREEAPSCISALIESLETRYYDKEVTGEFRLTSITQLQASGRTPARRYRIAGRTEFHTAEGFRGAESVDLIATAMGDQLLETTESTDGKEGSVSSFHSIDPDEIHLTEFLAEQFGSRTTTRGDDLAGLTLGEVTASRIVHTKRLLGKRSSSQAHIEAWVRFAQPIERPQGKGWHDPSTPPPSRICDGALVTVGVDDTGRPSAVLTIYYLPQE
jgi:hypothetical protein